MRWKKDGTVYYQQGQTIYCDFWFDGKRRRYSTGIKAGRGCRKAAQTVADAIKDKLKAEVELTDKSLLPTLQKCRAWEEENQQHNTKGNRKTTLKRCDAISEFFGPETTLGQITTAEVDKFVAHVRSTNTAGTTRLYLQILKRYYTVASRKGFKYHQPDWPVVKGKGSNDLGEKRKGHFISDQDFLKVYNHLKTSTESSQSCADLIYFALKTGLRKEELYLPIVTGKPSGSLGPR